ncbi:MAG: 4-hydroxy-3-methylbut-2-enyl diphosphate reductase [Proteiniphilum sp.]|jgi:4-hydroxy-3-methylbut-2-enyl diphosphate reductase|nr:4-hydroxy-3-methylbut-2-enyl diphosphate reductase [Proteiniphilum sp.]MDD2727060.1 4-hydroxy-3-methylbut-2-enyl diphosphate reductase [Proteiniphilum sp.]MDD3332584.1 4-hydroxy-3-methylbut-2-enyl diphosphate reductase [Proteiniphilum sp.]MDD3555144.1 4-hydroxy-3-methylbut-2-enyl diphosphate reductase [Proteiniphilum sp.]MDD3979565.1 4-hydroxy-3-methylbut-2-enyl diphosphate reductase [Proteiniphilum sp.]
MNRIEIDRQSGCCFGVAKAITRAEEELKKDGTLYCLGDIVHNSIEVERLEKMGMITIDHAQLKELKNVKVLLRAHGEPPSTYEIARENNIELIDASCPVVLGLQKKIRKKYEQGADKGIQIVIYGKKGHAEVKGLMGQTRESAIIIESKDEINKLDFTRDISLFSQTTKPLDGFYEIGELIRARMEEGAAFYFNDSICRQVSNRVPNIREFAENHDLIIFIAGEKSSNGKVLFDECKSRNPNSYLIHTPQEVDPAWIREEITIGICGATSTPQWQMEAVADIITKMSPQTQPERAAF